MSSQPQSGTSVVNILLIVGGAVLLLSMLAGFVAIGWFANSPVPTPAAPGIAGTSAADAPEPTVLPPGEPAAKIFDRPDVLKLVGKSQDDVRDMLGAPDRTTALSGRVIEWTYRYRTRTISGKIDAFFIISFDQAGKVSQVSF